MKIKMRMFLLMAAVLLLTACRVVVDTQLNANGSGKFRTAVVFTAQEKADFDKKPENASKSICGDAQKNVPADASFVEEVHDGETYCVTEHSFNSLAELRKFYASMTQVTVNTLQFESGKFMLDVDVDLTGENDRKGLVNEWHLTLPGTIGQNNAERVEGKTLIWVISPGEKVHLQAESVSDTATTPTAGTNALILIIGVLVALLLAAFVMIALLLQRNRQK